MESGEVFRFLERNQATVRGAVDGKHRFTQFRPRLAADLADEKSGIATR